MAHSNDIQHTYSWQQLTQLFDEMLHDIYGDVEICGMLYSAVDVWKQHDPIAYRCSLSDYVANNYTEDDEESDMYHSL